MLFAKQKNKNGVYYYGVKNDIGEKMKSGRNNETPKNVITYNAKIICDKESYDRAIDTMNLHNEMWNDVSIYLYEKTLSHEKKKSPGLKETHNSNYYELRKKYADSPSQIVIKAEQSAIAAYKTIVKNKDFDKMEAPAKKKRLSLQLDGRIFRMKNYNKFSMTTLDGRRNYEIMLYGKLSDMLKKYQMLDPKVFVADGEMFLSIPFELPVPICIEEKCIGVDLGIKRFATTSTGKSYRDKKAAGKKRKLRYNRKKLIAKRKTSNSAKRKLKANRGKETNISKQLCHTIANEILKEDANVIVLEDLSKIKKNKKRVMKKTFNSRNAQVPYHMFKEIITYKALSVGKRVETVSPYMTSQNDYRGVEKGKRENCYYYASDGKVFDADWNAAINIANRYSKHNNELPILFNAPIFGKLTFSAGRVNSPIV